MYEIKIWIRNKMMDFLLWALQKTEKYKNRTLSNRLHKIADEYDTRPTGEWNTSYRSNRTWGQGKPPQGYDWSDYHRIRSDMISHGIDPNDGY